MMSVAVTGCGCLNRLVHNGRLGGENHTRNRGCVDHCGVGDLDRVNDTLLNQVAVLEGCGVEALVVRQIGDAGDDDRTIDSCVGCNPVGGLAQAIARARTPTFWSPSNSSAKA